MMPFIHPFKVKKRGVVVSSCFLFSLYFLFILSRYRSIDLESFPPISFFDGGEQIGMAISSFLYKWIGAGAFSIPLFFLACGIMIHKEIPWSREIFSWLFGFLFSLSLFCSTASFLEDTPIVSTLMPSRGGMIGIFTSSLLVSFFGKVTGVILILCSIFLVCYTTTYILEKRILSKKRKKK